MATSLVKAPVYLQLNRALRELILSDQISVGGRFPPERQVSGDSPNKKHNGADKEFTR